jgi:hypothetical protein
MPIPSIYVTRFFQLVTARRFAEAERVLLRLRQKIPITEWNTGYFQALRGMLLAQKSNDDRYIFLANLNLKNQDELQRYRREFLRHAKNKLHADYDRGYFTAWASYMRVLQKLQLDADKTTSKTQKKKEIKAQAKAEKKVIEAKVRSKKEAEKKIKADTEEKEIEKAEGIERIEPRQSTLFDFSK